MFDKNKKYPIINFAVKLVLIFLFSFVLYKQISGKDFLDEMFAVLLNSVNSLKVSYLIIACALMPVNLWFESLKWKILVNQFEKHNTKASVFGVLTGMAAGLITPARLGDYAGRILLIWPENNWKAVWANLTGSIAQNIVTITLGIAGAIYFLTKKIQLDTYLLFSSIIFGVIITVLLLILYYNMGLLIRFGYKLKLNILFTKLFESLKIVHKFSPKVLNRVLLFSLSRYFVFLTQYVLLLLFWGVEGTWLLMLTSIALVFLIQLGLPLPPVLGLLARGEIALMVFSIFTENSLLILFATFGLWIINLAIPSLLGLLLIVNTNITKSFGYE